METIAVQPLDIVKTRFQLNQGVNPSVANAIRDLVREGGMMQLFRGLPPELGGNIPTRTAMYIG